MLGNLNTSLAMNVVEKAADKVSEPGKLEVVVVGLGTVFVGLICIVIICKIMSLCCGGAKKEKGTEERTVVKPAPVATAPIQNREEIIAAVCAAAAEELGTDVSAIRVRSFKRI